MRIDVVRLFIWGHYKLLCNKNKNKNKINFSVSLFIENKELFPMRPVL